MPAEMDSDLYNRYLIEVGSLLRRLGRPGIPEEKQERRRKRLAVVKEILENWRDPGTLPRIYSHERDIYDVLELSHLRPKPGDTPERRQRRLDIVAAILKARSRGAYDVLEHKTGEILGDLLSEPLT